MRADSSETAKGLWVVINCLLDRIIAAGHDRINRGVDRRLVKKYREKVDLSALCEIQGQI